MAKNGTEAVVFRLPKCDIHNGEHEAKYDASIFVPEAGRRVWANVCEAAFVEGGGRLGLGLGQKLVLHQGDK